MASDGLVVPNGISQPHHHVSKDRTHHTVSEETSSRLSGVLDHEDQDRTPFIAVSPIQQNDGPTFTPAGTAEKRKPRTEHLTTSNITLLAVIAYIVLFLFAWLMLCLLANIPLSTKSYGVRFDTDPSGQAYIDGTYRTAYQQSERLARAARVIWVVVAVLTLPVVSAACAAAAAVYVQRRASKWTLRQTMTLADRAWQSPVLTSQALMSFKRYGSSFLLLALALNALAFILLPLQSILLSSRNIKTPYGLTQTTGLTDIFDPLSLSTSQRSAVVAAREAMASVNINAPNNRLWTRNTHTISCKLGLQYDEDTGSYLQLPCTGRGANLANMSTLVDPFWAQLPTSSSTGLIRQFLLRVNSTATQETITAADFPANCSSSDNSFFASYAGLQADLPTVQGSYYSVVACMPGNQTKSPWTATRARQDFYEDLYLNISLSPTGENDTVSYYKIRLNTTAGYFELPNYMNGQKPGPLLTDGPSSQCGTDCYQQGTYPRYLKNSSLTGRGYNITGDMSANSLSSEIRLNNGPLLTTAIALFGNGSILSTRTLHPDSYSLNYTSYSLPRSFCYERIPFMPLLQKVIPPICATPADQYGILTQLYGIVKALYNGAQSDALANAFTVAAFLSNEAWLTTMEPAGGLLPTFSVSYDMGADTTIPAISKGAIVGLAVLMGIFLAGLLAVAIYGRSSAVWTHQLDSWTMLRIGASLAESSTLRVGDATKSDIPDQTPGWIGDSTQGEGQYGEVAMGGVGRLNKRRAYLSI